MKLYSTIAQSPQPSTSIDIPLPSGSDSVWLVLAAIVGGFINQIFPKIWGHYQKQEEQESQITSTLVNNLLENNQKLLAGNLAGFQALEAGQEKVQKAIEKLGETISLEVQSTLKQQGLSYASVLQMLTEQKYLIDALHERYDRQEIVIQTLGEKLGLVGLNKDLDRRRSRLADAKNPA